MVRKKKKKKKKKASTILGHCPPSSFHSCSLTSGFNQITSLWERKGRWLLIIIIYQTNSCFSLYLELLLSLRYVRASCQHLTAPSSDCKYSFAISFIIL
jgi:hypothetical protein